MCAAFGAVRVRLWLKSDRFGMEIKNKNDDCIIGRALVKIRPFRYGNKTSKLMEVAEDMVKIRPFRYGNFSVLF